MAIRLRVVDGTLIAICAARSVEKSGDVYLDDGQHHALGLKFSRDYNEMYETDLPEGDDHALVDQEESNNPKAEWWEYVYGGKEPDEGLYIED